MEGNVVIKRFMYDDSNCLVQNTNDILCEVQQETGYTCYTHIYYTCFFILLLDLLIYIKFKIFQNESFFLCKLYM